LVPRVGRSTPGRLPSGVADGALPRFGLDLIRDDATFQRVAVNNSIVEACETRNRGHQLCNAGTASRALQNVGKAPRLDMGPMAAPLTPTLDPSSAPRSRTARRASAGGLVARARRGRELGAAATVTPLKGEWMPHTVWTPSSMEADGQADGGKWHESKTRRSGKRRPVWLSVSSVTHQGDRAIPQHTRPRIMSSLLRIEEQARSASWDFLCYGCAIVFPHKQEAQGPFS
jgi:hypothetical protein